MKYFFIFSFLFCNFNLYALQFCLLDIPTESITKQPNTLSDTNKIVSKTSNNFIGANDKLVFKNGVFLKGKKLQPDAVRQLMFANKGALQTYNAGRDLYVVGNVVSIPFGFALGWDLGTRLGGGKGNNTLLGVAAAGSLVTVVAGLLGESKIKKAFNIFNNSGNKNSSLLNKVSFSVKQTGVGFSIEL